MHGSTASRKMRGGLDSLVETLELADPVPLIELHDECPDVRNLPAAYRTPISHQLSGITVRHPHPVGGELREGSDSLVLHSIRLRGLVVILLQVRLMPLPRCCNPLHRLVWVRDDLDGFVRLGIFVIVLRPVWKLESGFYRR